MTRTLTTMPREAFDFFIPSKVLRAGDGLNTIYAMHWDGTYRDHDAYSNGFWTDLDYANYGQPTTARLFAKHIAPNQIPDEPTPFDSGPY